MAKILIVEDDEAMSDMLAALLSAQKYVTEQVFDGTSALERIRHYEYDLLLIDWGLPDLSGPELCKQIKSIRSTLPILMLTAMSKVEDKTHGLESGADDYLTKPIDREEFPARIRALLRRSSAKQDTQITYKDLVLDPVSGRCTRNGRKVSLAPKEVELLELLMRQPGEHVQTEAVILRLWGSEGSRASLANCLKRLRSKLNEAGEVDLIETAPGTGYRLT